MTCLTARPGRLTLACTIGLIVFHLTAWSQTYQVNPDNSVKPKNPPAKGQAPQRQLGFGSNIQNARLARAADMALKRGDRPLALEYAQRAAQAAPNDPELWFMVGYVARLQGKYPLSVTAFEKGLSLNPSSINGMSGLAQTYAQMGRTNEAETLIKKVLAADPSQRDDLEVLADIYMKAGNYTDAIGTLNQAERVKPDARTELMLAINYEHLKQMDQANRFLEMAKRRAPGNPDVERSLANYYRETGDFVKAIDSLKAIRKPPPDVVAELGYTYGLYGKLDEAAKYYAQAANAVPHDLNLQLSAAQSYVELNDVDQANDFLKRAATLDANNYRLHAIRGTIARTRDDDEQAAEEYKQAIAAMPSTPPEGPLYPIELRMDLVAMYHNLNKQQDEQQQLQMAQTEIAKLDEQGADRPAFLRLRAEIETSADQPDKALEDLKQSIALKPNDPATLQLAGDVLMKLNRVDDAIAAYSKALDLQPHSRFALTSLGYAERAAGNNTEAERYFNELAQYYPTLYVPYLALGDLYTSLHQYKRAQDYYAKGYQVAPKNALIVAGGINAAVERHDLKLAASWVDRAKGPIGDAPEVMAEEERYYRFSDQPKISEELGEKAIRFLPRNRDVVVYLGYDMLSLNQYDDLSALTQKYEDLLPKDRDIPLLAGYVYRHNHEPEKAVASFSEVLRRDPTVVTAYINRGFVYNDIHKPELAAPDFEQALKLEPKDGEAHLGLAYADLAMNRNLDAVHEAGMALRYSGDSGAIHEIRANAYGREGMLAKAATEYKAAIKYSPNNGVLHFSLGGILFGERQFRDAAKELAIAEKLLPGNAEVYALEARTYAGLGERQQALSSIHLAEEYATRMPPPATDTSPRPSDIYVSTGQAYQTLGNQDAAMTSFSKALTSPYANRVGVRLAIGQLMAQQGHKSDAERQIALAQMEADAGDTPKFTGGQYIEAGGILQQLHEYELSESYLERARQAGASEIKVRTSLANTYLALGDTSRAAAELAAVPHTDESKSDYEFLLAQASLYQQEHRDEQAISAFARAASQSGQDPTAEQQLLTMGANEGYSLGSHAGVLSNLMQQPIYENSTVYSLDAKTFGNPPAITGRLTRSAELPPMRYSIETDWTNAYHLHFGAVPAVGGFFQIRNTRGVVSVPAIGVVKRHTTDYNFNFGVNPTIPIGHGMLSFNTGWQGTVRRDSVSPRDMNQNINRFYTYLNTSSFFDAVSVNAFVIRDFGGFTQLPLYEHTLAGGIDFRVGSPWGRTALITGWGRDDQNFTSTVLGNTENYYTSSYIGLTHRFSHLNVEAMAEDIRSWRIVPFAVTPGKFAIYSGTAQALRPAGTIEYSPSRNWSFRLSSAYEDTRDLHLYDRTENGFAVSYMRPFGRTFNEDSGQVHIKYPIRISAGVEEQMFPNLTQGRTQEVRPYVSITIF